MNSATSKEFDKRLRELMPELDRVADRQERFRHYLQDSFMPRAGLRADELFVKAAERFAQWREQGVSDTDWRFGIVPDFNRWWSAQVSATRSEARKPAKKRKGTKKTLAGHR